MKKLSNKVALITGASRGIGAAVAKRFISEGANVIITARTVGGLEEVDDFARKNNTTATIIPLDLKETKKIPQMADAIAQKFGKLDILVCNAGTLGYLSPITHCQEQTWNEVMNINLNANFHLLKNFDPLLKQSENGRVIFVSSGVAKTPFPYWSAYSVSKAALEMFAKVYASENNLTKIKANIIDPGVVRTKMRAEAMPGENPSNLPNPEDITDIFVKLAEDKLSETGKVFKA